MTDIDELAYLRQRVRDLEIELKEREQDRINAYSLMSEVVRLRRMVEIREDEAKECREKKEKAERGLRNLIKWMNVNIELEGAPTK